jgi:hypothetical protein
MTNAPSPERRRFHRIAFHAPITIEQGGQAWQSDLIDISLKGILTRRPSDWSGLTLGTPCTYRLPLDADHVVSVEAKLMHQESDRLGFECVTMDIDSATLLRRLVELNLGDPELLDRDFAALLTGQ